MKKFAYNLLYNKFPSLWFFLKYRIENEYQNYIYSRHEIIAYANTLKKYLAIVPVLNKIMINKTFLEIGCDAGFFPLQAAVLGAKKCVGVDRNIKALKKAEKARKMLNLSQVEFFEATIPDIGLKEKFDTVLIMSTMHYMFSDTIGNKLLFTKMDDYIGFLDNYVKEFLLIEYIELDDPAAKILISKKVLQSGEYSKEKLIESLEKRFSSVVNLGQTHYTTRSLYLACRENQ